MLNLSFKTSLIFIFISLLLAGCKKKDEEDKQPSADFTTDKGEYTSGDIIFLKNNSTNAETYRWTLPDGTTSKSSDLSYYTNAEGGDAMLTFKLEAFSKNGTKTDFVVKNIHLKAGIGGLVIWSRWVSNTVNVSIDGIKQYGIQMAPKSYIPNCWEANTATFDLKSGPHLWIVDGYTSGYYSNVPFSITGTVTIKSGNCSPVELQE
jgi:hypothetical protein